MTKPKTLTAPRGFRLNHAELFEKAPQCSTKQGKEALAKQTGLSYTTIDRMFHDAKASFRPESIDKLEWAVGGSLERKPVRSAKKKAAAGVLATNKLAKLDVTVIVNGEILPSAMIRNSDKLVLIVPLSSK